MNYCLYVTLVIHSSSERNTLQIYTIKVEMVMKIGFRGLMAPVFTPFKAGGDLNLNLVEKYAKYLAEMKIEAVLVNGTVGEGVSMTSSERKSLLEAWSPAGGKFGLKIVAHVGGTNLKEVLELAQHAESLQVAGILCLPDLAWRPKDVRALTDYLKIVSEAAPKTPLLYYHYPALTGIDLDMESFLNVGYEEIPTLAGMKFTHTDLVQGMKCFNSRGGNFTIFLGCDQLIAPAFAAGFDSMICTTLNVCPDDIREIRRNIEEGRVRAAAKIQGKINLLASYISQECGWISGFKKGISFAAKLDLGDVRQPLKALTSRESSKLEVTMKALGF